MAQKKKLQVFVSSTYTDLREERQAAVEAILTAGHIPAGMELFAAGDESQMNVIKRWIDESDVYLLILGGRYGSLEPKSQKSYIHLEYDYAVEKAKPLFAVIIEEGYAKERVKTHPLGVEVIETENPQKLKEFRAQVLTKMVRFWRDPKDIKLAILETVADFSRRDDLVGWIPGSESVNTGAVAEEIARLGKENAALREQLTNSRTASATFSGLSFEEMYNLLATSKIDVTRLEERLVQNIEKIASIFGDKEPGLVHVLWMISNWLQVGKIINDDQLRALAYKAISFDVVERELRRGSSVFKLTNNGRQFLIRLRLERNTEEAEQFIF